MSQLRAPPSARARTAPEFGSTYSSKKDYVPQTSNLNPNVKLVGADHMHPRLHEDAMHADMKLEGSNGNMMHADALPGMHIHGHMKPSHWPHMGFSSSALPLHGKQGPTESFMDSCYSCKRPLGHGRDIFMYRGDAAFCTEECRLWQISCDERRQKCSVSVSQKGSVSIPTGSSKCTRKVASAGAS